MHKNVRTFNVKNLFSNKSIIKLVLFLAIPAIIENVLQVFIGVVDTYFVGKIGTEAVAGVGAVNLIFNIYISFFIAIGVGVSAIVSRNKGAGKIKNADEAVKQSILMGLAIGVFFGIINLLLSNKIFMLLGIENTVLKYAKPYFLVTAVPCVFLCIMMILSSALRGAGDTVTPMVAVAVSNIVNAVLDYILIFGVLNFNGIGIIGAGVAATISRIIGVIILLSSMNNKRTGLNVRLKDGWSFNKKILKSITNIGIPAAGERLIMRIGQLVYGALIIKIGTEAYAAHNIAGTIESFSYLPGLGFGAAAATLVGQYLGADKFEDAKRAGIISYILSTVIMVIMGGIVYIFAPTFAALFTQDLNVKNMIVRVLRIIALFQPFLCSTLVITAGLQGAGDTKFPMYSTFIGIWGVRVLGVVVLGIIFKMGLVGVWISYAFDVFLRGIILFVRFLKGKWRYIEIQGTL